MFQTLFLISLGLCFGKPGFKAEGMNDSTSCQGWGEWELTGDHLFVEVVYLYEGESHFQPVRYLLAVVSVIGISRSSRSMRIGKKGLTVLRTKEVYY